MTHQQSLFDDPMQPAHFTAAPIDTRREAVRRLEPEVNRLQAQVLAFIRDARRFGRTDEEITLALKMRPDTARARRCELRDAGLAVDSGHTRMTESGRRAVVWIAAEFQESISREIPPAAGDQVGRIAAGGKSRDAGELAAAEPSSEDRAYPAGGIGGPHFIDRWLAEQQANGFAGWVRRKDAAGRWGWERIDRD